MEGLLVLTSYLWFIVGPCEHELTIPVWWIKCGPCEQNTPSNGNGLRGIEVNGFHGPIFLFLPYIHNSFINLKFFLLLQHGVVDHVVPFIYFIYRITFFQRAKNRCLNPSKLMFLSFTHIHKINFFFSTARPQNKLEHIHGMWDSRVHKKLFVNFLKHKEHCLNWFNPILKLGFSGVLLDSILWFVINQIQNYILPIWL